MGPKQVYRSTLGGLGDLNYPYDYIEIRLADTYLMEAEALVHAGGNITRAQALVDAVRARVGLTSIPVTLASIYDERRVELATEGHRFLTWYVPARQRQTSPDLQLAKMKYCLFL